MLIKEKKVEWFIRNVNLQIQDIELQNSDVKIESYFDTNNIQETILGVLNFYNRINNKLKNIDEFKADKFIIYSLLLGGYLGSVNLLPPHQAELLLHINNSFNLGNNAGLPYKEIIERFIRDLDKKEIIQINNRNNLIDEIIKQQGISVEIFKLLGIIEYVSWKIRLTKLVRNKNLILDEANDFDFSELIKREEFIIIKRAFDKERPLLTINNFADTISLLILIIIVEKFNKGETKTIPRFWSTGTITNNIIRKLELDHLLSYKLNNKWWSVLRDSDYFLFKSIFQTPNNYIRNNDINDIDRIRTDLIEIKDKLELLLIEKGTITEQEFTSIFKQKSFDKLLTEFNALTFFKIVQLPYFKKNIEGVTGNNIKNILLDLTKKSFQDDLNKEIHNISYNLKNNIGEYSRINKFWFSIEKELIELKNIYKDRNFSLANYRGFGLIRFSFPKEYLEDVCKIFQNLISEDDNVHNTTIMDIISDYNKLYNKVEIDEKNKIELFCILWILKKDNEILEIINENYINKPLSLIILKVASKIRTRKNIIKAYDEISYLEDRFNKLDDKVEKIKLAIGLGYLYFHYWQLSRFNSAKKTDSADEKTKKTKSKEIRKAIFYAKYASSSIEEINENLVYATNQYLYYLVEGGSDRNITLMKKTTKYLASLKIYENYWSYRYDDTLARYYFRLYLIDEKNKKTNKNRAHFYMDESLRNGGNLDVEVTAFKAVLDAETV